MTWNGYEALQARLGAAYYIGTFCFLESIQGVILICIFHGVYLKKLVPEEKEVYMREQASSLYYPSAYFLARILAELPLNFIVPIATLLTSYWTWDFNASEPYKFFILCILMSNTIKNRG